MNILPGWLYAHKLYALQSRTLTHMNHATTEPALKKPVNVSINADLLVLAKKLKINLSAALEGALIEMVNARQREQWKIENQAAIEVYNRTVQKNGVFSDGLRKF